MIKANVKNTQNKNRNTWAKLNEGHKANDSNGKTSGTCGDIREASILQAARASFAQGIKQARTDTAGVIEEDILEKFVMSAKVSKNIATSCNFLRFCKMVFYHLLFPFSSSIVTKSTKSMSMQLCQFISVRSNTIQRN